VTSDDIKTAWVSSKVIHVDRPWGHEKVWRGTLLSTYAKTIYIKEGHRTSLKYHRQKNEMLHLQEGKARVTFGDELTLKHPLAHPYREEIIEAGQCLCVQSACPYRIEALVDCLFIEIGDHHLDKPVRLEDDFGRIK